MKKTLFLLLAILTVSFSASAYNFMVDGLCYNKNSDGTSVTVTYQNSSYTRYSNLNGDLTIPSTVTYSGKTYSVTSIGDNAFGGCSGLTSVTIPNSVTKIGYKAFYECSGLTSVTIGNSVTSIGGYAFYGCRGLTSVTIPNSVKSIGDYAFSGCSGLTSVTIPNSVTNIGYEAFYECSGLTSVTIGNSVTSIGSSAFSGCSGLTSVTIPNSVTSIGYSAFRQCSGLTSVTIGNSVTSIGSTAFSGCSGLTSVAIPNSVTSIGGNAFSSCSGLTSIVVESGNTKYDSRNNCNAIIETATNTLVTGCMNTLIPNSVTSIGYSAFEGCTGLTSVTIPNSVTTIGSYAFEHCSGLTSVTIPNSVTSIGDGAFKQCSGLTSVTIPNSVTSIGDYTFYGCSGLTSVTIPNSVTSIGGYAFEYCTGLTSVTIPNSVTSIGKFAFSYCSGLTSVTIPNSVTSIGSNFLGMGNNAFVYSGLTSIVVESGNTKYDSRNNCNAIIETATNTLVTGCMNTLIPNSVTSISGYAFYGCSGLTSVTIPNSVTTIGVSAFYGCSGLTSVTIPNSVTSISSWAFDGCSGLNYVLCLPVTPPSGSDVMFPTGMTIYVPSASLNAYKAASYWKSYNIYPFDEPSCNVYYTSIKIYGGPFITINSATVNGNNYYPENEEINVDGLLPGTNYQMTVNYAIEGEDNQTKVFDVTTKVPSFSSSFSITQTSVTPQFTVTRDPGFVPEKCGVTINGTNYNGNITESTDGYHRIVCPKISGLDLNTNYDIELWVEYKGTKYSSNATFKTSGIGISSQKSVGPTSANITVDYSAGDAVVQDTYFTFGGQNYDKSLNVTGLKPETSYSTTCTVVTKSGSQSQGINFTTPVLSMVAQPARMLSNTSPLLMATTNVADEETGCGFEWRRYDAPAEMPSTKVFSPVADGMIMGVVNNMSENVYYKYRPFYRASDGTEYYGDWVAFITADAGVYYEPVAYTYAQYLVDGNNVTINGMAMPGSENIISQGFAYWLNTPAHAPATEPKSVPSDGVTTITASGQRMSATLTDLQRGKTYSYCAFVKTDSGTFYGAERTFTTEGLPGDVNGDGMVTAADITALYDYMLNNDGSHLVTGDQTGDGIITAADITAVYTVMLGN